MKYGDKVIITGNYACFTRPELKTERITYDVPTPGALEGMLKAIYWKPAFRYVIDKIVVCNPFKYIHLMRSGVSHKLSLNQVVSSMNGKSDMPYVNTCDSDDKILRSAKILKDVKYMVQFHIELTGIRDEREVAAGIDQIGKHISIFRDRMRSQHCFTMPYFGCREFPITSMKLINSFDMSQISPEVISMGNVDLGYMNYKVKHKDGGRPSGKWEDQIWSDESTTEFYHPHMVRGMIDVALYRREGMLC